MYGSYFYKNNSLCTESYLVMSSRISVSNIKAFSFTKLFATKMPKLQKMHYPVKHLHFFNHVILALHLNIMPNISSLAQVAFILFTRSFMLVLYIEFQDPICNFF